MNKSDLERLTEERLKDAEILLKNGRWSGAYYLSGYVVECAIKACIAKQTKAFDFPPNPEKSKQIYTHKIAVLLEMATLTQQRNRDMKADALLRKYWSLVEAWTESARYNEWTETQARELYEAVTDPQLGIYQWITRFW